MRGKKDNHDIFNQYKSILLEQVDVKSYQSFIDKIKAANFDQRLKGEILELLGNPMVENAYNILHNVGDADTAGYSSYPEAGPATDQDDQDTANEPDPEFAKELAKAKKEQQEKYPEQDEEEKMPTEAPWWVPGDENKKRWLTTRQGIWKKEQKEKEEHQS